MRQHGPVHAPDEPASTEVPAPERPVDDPADGATSPAARKPTEPWSGRPVMPAGSPQRSSERHSFLHPVEGLMEMTEDVAPEVHTSKWKIVGRMVFLLVAMVTLYFLMPQLVAVWSEIPRLREIGWWWFPVMLILEALSIMCLWRLVTIALPTVSYFVAGTAQLSGNAVSKIVPGGGPVGAALQLRMLSVSGIETASAVSAVGATGLLSTWVLFALPFTALLVSFLGSPVPKGMGNVAWGGAFVFILMFLLGLAVVRSDRLLDTVGPWIERANRWVMARLGREGGLTAAELKRQRDQMVETLGGNFRDALLAAVGNWLLDYLVLVVALLAIGSEPKLSLVLLAYAVSAVLGMIPITPGGLGFVEAGLTATLTLAGVPSQEALLATLAYRLFSYWLPLPTGLGAYITFRRHYGNPPTANGRTATAAAT